MDIVTDHKTGMIGYNMYGIMSNELNLTTDPGQPMVYQVRSQGYLDRQQQVEIGGQ